MRPQQRVMSIGFPLVLVGYEPALGQVGKVPPDRLGDGERNVEAVMRNPATPPLPVMPQKLLSFPSVSAACGYAPLVLAKETRVVSRSEEPTSELQSLRHLVCR